MTSLRKTLMTQLQTVIEADTSIFHATDITKVNRVIIEPTKIKINSNTLTIIPRGTSKSQKDLGSDIDLVTWDFDLTVQFKQITRESNDNLYQVVENLWKLFYHNTLSGNCEDSYVTGDVPYINEGDQTLVDGFDIHLLVESMEAL